MTTLTAKESLLSQQRIKENIALLLWLGAEPGEPKMNPWPQHLTHDDPTATSRKLQLQQEIDLVDNFAFLLATTDDPEKVVAVCLEEHSNGAGVIIRIADNSGDVRDRAKEFEAALRPLTEVTGKGA